MGIKNKIMNNIDKQYTDLLQDILDNGVEKETRNGKTLSVFGRQIRHRMSAGFPLLTTKKMAFKSIVTELLWFLRGDTNIKFLVDNNCHIWDGDAYKNYEKKYFDYKDGFVGIDVDDSRNNEIRKYTKEEFINKIKTDDEFAKKWGDLGPIYGKQWRNWETTNVRCRKFEEIYNMSDDSIVVEKSTIDQIQNLINELKTNPDSRRLLVSAWAVHDLSNMVLPPCHYGFQVYTRELNLEEMSNWFNNNVQNGTKWYVEMLDDKEFLHDMVVEYNAPTRAISLMWNQRSVDTGLGLSFNIASYSLLLMMIAKQVNMIPDELIGNLGDVHLYLNHIDPIKEQLTREPYELPTVKISDRVVNDISEYTLDDIILENYQSHPTIKMPLSN
jgi:thymidylate synthase